MEYSLVGCFRMSFDFIELHDCEALSNYQICILAPNDHCISKHHFFNLKQYRNSFPSKSNGVVALVISFISGVSILSLSSSNLR
jgi:hypothetical protein